MQTGRKEAQHVAFVLELRLLDGRVINATITQPENYEQLQREIARIEPQRTGFLVVRTDERVQITPESFPLQGSKAIAQEIQQCVKPRIRNVGIFWERDEFRQPAERGKLSELARDAKALRQEDATWR